MMYGLIEFIPDSALEKKRTNAVVLVLCTTLGLSPTNGWSSSDCEKIL